VSADIQKRALHIAKRLDDDYGVRHRERASGSDLLEVLILTILSQNTNDLNRDRAMENLKKHFPTWESVAKADRKKVEDAIRVGGLAHQKSARIQDVLLWVKKTFGRYSLEGLDKIPTSEARDMLMNLKGVGPKTAAIVLLFGLGRPLFPVDTHIHRVTTRLGLLPEGATAEKAHELLGALFPQKRYYSSHLNIIQHGKTICKARKPVCNSCVLIKTCHWPEKNPGMYV